jgi:hypothetical protein
VSGNGDVYLSDRKGYGKQGYVRFSSTGKRLGVERTDIDPYRERWYFVPGTSRRWVVGYKALYLVAENGSVARKITRTPDGEWLRDLNRAVVLPDGTIALHASSGPPKDPHTAIHIYNAKGEPVRSLPAPPGLSGTQRFAFDGARFAGVIYVGEGLANEVLFFDLEGQPLMRFAIEHGRNRIRRVWFAADGKELWLHDGKYAIERYALPD